MYLFITSGKTCGLKNINWIVKTFQKNVNLIIILVNMKIENYFHVYFIRFFDYNSVYILKYTLNNLINFHPGGFPQKYWGETMCDFYWILENRLILMKLLWLSLDIKWLNVNIDMIEWHCAWECMYEWHIIVFLMCRYAWYFTLMWSKSQ